jgi:hypothetical protein
MEGGKTVKRLSLPRLKGLKGFSASPLLRWSRILAVPLAVAAIGFLLGMVASQGVEILFRRHLLEGVYSWALREDDSGPTPATDPLGEGLKTFVEANPFAIDRLLRSDISVAETEESRQRDESLPLTDARLIGTLPPEGAFIVAGESVLFLLRGQIEGGFELIDVTADRALFRDGEGQERILFLEFSKTEPSGPKSTKAAPDAAPAQAASPAAAGKVVAAAPGKEGAVDRDLVNSLLMNPFEELRKIRLQPHIRDGNPVGIEVRFIRDDSILRQLGVSRGDVIQAVNGVQIQNMNDVANAISSLMGGSRFDVSVLRGGGPVELSYTVK